MVTTVVESARTVEHGSKPDVNDYQCLFENTLPVAPVDHWNLAAFLISRWSVTAGHTDVHHLAALFVRFAPALMRCAKHLVALWAREDR